MEVDLGTLLQKVVREAYTELHALTTTLTPLASKERKKALQHHATHTRHRLLRLTALLLHAQSSLSAPDTASLLSALSSTAATLEGTALGLHTAAHAHKTGDAPRFATRDALDALAASSSSSSSTSTSSHVASSLFAPSFSRGVVDGITSLPSPKTQGALLSLLDRRISNALLALPPPPKSTSLVAEAGVAKLVAPGEYAVSLSLNVDPDRREDDPVWYVRGLVLALKTTSGDGKPVTLALPPDQHAALIHVVFEGINSELGKRDPLGVAHRMLHTTCLRLRLDVLAIQAKSLLSSSWWGVYPWDLNKDTSGFDLGFWSKHTLRFHILDDSVDLTFDPSHPSAESLLSSALTRQINVLDAPFEVILSAALDAKIKTSLESLIHALTSSPFQASSYLHFSLASQVSHPRVGQHLLRVTWMGSMAPRGALDLGVSLGDASWIVLQTSPGLGVQEAAAHFVSALPSISDPSWIEGVDDAAVSFSLALERASFVAAAKAAGFVPSASPHHLISRDIVRSLAPSPASLMVYCQLPDHAMSSYVAVSLSLHALPRFWILMADTRSGYRGSIIHFGAVPPSCFEDVPSEVTDDASSKRKRSHPPGNDHQNAPKSKKLLSGEAAAGAAGADISAGTGVSADLASALQSLRRNVSRACNERLLDYMLDAKNIVSKTGSDGIILHVDCGKLPVSSMVLKLAPSGGSWAVHIHLTRPMVQVGDPSVRKGKKDVAVGHIVSSLSGTKIVMTYLNTPASVNEFLRDLKGVIRVAELNTGLDAVLSSGSPESSLFSVHARSYGSIVLRVDASLYDANDLYLVISFGRAGLELALEPQSSILDMFTPAFAQVLNKDRDMAALLETIHASLPVLRVLEHISTHIPRWTLIPRSASCVRILLRPLPHGVDVRFLSPTHVYITDAAQSLFVAKSLKETPRPVAPPSYPAISALISRLSLVPIAVAIPGVGSGGAPPPSSSSSSSTGPPSLSPATAKIVSLDAEARKAVAKHAKGVDLSIQPIASFDRILHPSSDGVVPMDESTDQGGSVLVDNNRGHHVVPVSALLDTLEKVERTTVHVAAVEQIHTHFASASSSPSHVSLLSASSSGPHTPGSAVEIEVKAVTAETYEVKIGLDSSSTLALLGITNPYLKKDDASRISSVFGDCVRAADADSDAVAEVAIGFITLFRIPLDSLKPLFQGLSAMRDSCLLLVPQATRFESDILSFTIVSPPAPSHGSLGANRLDMEVPLNVSAPTVSLQDSSVGANGAVDQDAFAHFAKEVGESSASFLHSLLAQLPKFWDTLFPMTTTTVATATTTMTT